MSLKSQTFFNETFDWGNVEAGGGVELIEDTLYTLSWSTDLVKKDLIVSKFDLDGNKIIDFVISDSTSLNSGYHGFFVDSDTNLVGYGEVKVADTSRPYVFKMTRGGQLLWSKYFYFDSEQMMLNSGCLGNDSNYVFCGHQYVPGSGWEYFYLKSDTAGNLMDSEVFGGGSNDSGLSIQCGLDSGYLISGFNKSVEPEGDHYLLKLNEAGDEEWFRSYGTTLDFEGGWVSKGQDHYWIFGNWTTAAGFTGHVSKLNSLGFIQDQIIMDIPEIQFANLYAGYEDNRGNFVASGTIRLNGSGNFEGWLFKVDSNCNAIWSRTLSKRTSDHYIQDIVQLDDSSIVGIGYVFPEGVMTQDMWMFRADSMGCINAGCSGVGLLEPLALIPIKTYPNPVDHQTKFQVEGNSRFDEIVIMDISGALVKSIQIAGEVNQINVNLSDLSSGLYMAAISLKGARLGVVELVKN